MGIKKIAITAVMTIVLCLFSGLVIARADVTKLGSLESLADEDELINELLTSKEKRTGKEATVKKVKWNDNFTKKDLRYMSAIIFCEANNLEWDAKIAVANVILNRMRDTDGWGHVTTIKQVIYDKKWGVQFSPIRGNPSSMDKAIDVYTNLDDYEGNWKYDSMKECILVAKAAFCGEKAVPDSYMYFNAHVKTSMEKCKKNNKSYRVIGEHIYY